MLVIYWGITKFEYRSKGRMFRLVTDHMVLQEIREKPTLTTIEWIDG